MKRALALCCLAFVMVAAACTKSTPAGPSTRLTIVVNAPFSVSPFVGQSIAHGVELAVQQIDAAGGVDAISARYTFVVERLDNALSPQKALDNVRKAVAEKAVAIIDEGTGVNASWPVANAAHIPLCIAFQGGEGLVDPVARPNVFRIAPTDHGVAFRLAEYLAGKHVKAALLHDDTDYGQQGLVAFQDAFGHVPDEVAGTPITVPADQSDPSPEVLQARQSGATGLIVWAEASTVANVVRAARTAGWNIPIYAAPSGEDPLVRQQLSDHPEWVDGLTFASGRMTAERGPGPFLAFEAAFEKAFGPDEVGVKTSAGKPVIQPPDVAMYAYDFVNVLAAAIKAAHSGDAKAVLATLTQVDARGANGDERSFNEKNHDGVVDDDVYFAAFHDMTSVPVKDDPLSSTLPTIAQTR